MVARSFLIKSLRERIKSQSWLAETPCPGGSSKSETAGARPARCRPPADPAAGWGGEGEQEDGQTRDRLLAVTNHRVVTYKKSTLGSRRAPGGHVRPDSRVPAESEMELHFKDWFVKFSHPKAGTIFKFICERQQDMLPLA